MSTLMESIIIGQVDTLWKNPIPDIFYARRRKSNEHAFGLTAIEALKALEAHEAHEAHEATSVSNIDEDLALEIAFLALGAASYLNNCHGNNFNAHGGYMSVISKVIHQAPVLSETWKRMDSNEFGGVWLYDVTMRVGREWAEEIIGKSGLNPEQLIDCIIKDEMEKWS